MIRIILLFILLLTTSTSSIAKGTYQQPDEFVKQAFEQARPEAQVLWIKGNLLKQVEDILQHRYKGKRTRYWQQNKRSVWVLEEVGKKKPITVGIIIDDNKISQLKVLIFRETRGWEVRYPFFTKQFNLLFLEENNQLSTTIDSISGATLSVRALEKLARISLLLNKEIHKKVSQ